MFKHLKEGVSKTIYENTNIGMKWKQFKTGNRVNKENHRGETRNEKYENE